LGEGENLSRVSGSEALALAPVPADARWTGNLVDLIQKSLQPYELAQPK
jgi:hypothetical protein